MPPRGLEGEAFYHCVFVVAERDGRTLSDLILQKSLQPEAESFLSCRSKMLV